MALSKLCVYLAKGFYDHQNMCPFCLSDKFCQSFMLMRVMLYKEGTYAHIHIFVGLLLCFPHLWAPCLRGFSLAMH